MSDSPEIPEVRCKYCAVWDEETSTCRHDPPKLVTLKEHSSWMWPPVNPDDWCGSFVPSFDEDSAEEMAQFFAHHSDGDPH